MFTRGWNDEAWEYRTDGRRNYNQLTRNAVSVGNGYPRVERRSVGVLIYPRAALCIALSPAAPHRAAVVRRISVAGPTAVWTWRWARTLAVLGGPVKRDPRAGRESHAGGIFARSRAGARWETCKESRGASISCSGCKVKWTLGCQISEQRLTESPPQKRACARSRGPVFEAMGTHLY